MEELCRRILSVMTDAVPVFFVSANGVSGRAYCVPGAIYGMLHH